MRSAIGLMAGPDRPPKMVAIFGFRVRASMAIPVIVLMMERPSAPPSAQALASETMSEVLGVSLIQSGFLITSRQARTRSRSTRGSVPNSIPPALMFGQETFISSAVDAVQAVEPRPAVDVLVEGAPKKFTSTRVPHVPQVGQLLALEALDADVLEANRVDHARRGLADARRGVAEAGLRRDPLGDEAAERAEVGELLELLAVAERPRGGQHRVSKGDTARLDGQTDSFMPGRPGDSTGGLARATSSTSAASKPGRCCRRSGRGGTAPESHTETDADPAGHLLLERDEAGDVLVARLLAIAHSIPFGPQPITRTDLPRCWASRASSAPGDQSLFADRAILGGKEERQPHRFHFAEKNQIGRAATAVNHFRSVDLTTLRRPAPPA